MEFFAENHPRIVHFAIAFLFVYPVLETIGIIFKNDFFSKTAHLVLFIGVLAAVGGVLTGNQAQEVAVMWEEQGAIMPFKAINEHREYATITLFYFAGLLILRTFFVIKKKFTGNLRYIFLVLAVVGIYFVYETGDRGGTLVYKHGVGTQLKQMETEE